jgi:hypothetical protein
MIARPTRGRPRAISKSFFGLSAIAGIALWLTPAAFDVIITRPDSASRAADRAVRIAMLPPLWQLPVFMIAAALGLIAIMFLLPRGGDAGDSSTSTPPSARSTPSAPSDVLLPAAALGLLILPYLPWLPDTLPILRLLAGPGRALIWFTVFALIARGFWRAVPRRVRLSDAPPRAVAAALFVIGTLISGATATVFTRTILFPGGDEPHYLIIAQSLWRDHDLKIENNHTRQDYREYFEGDLRPHYLKRGSDSEIYSIHPIGVSVLLTPIYALGGYTLVVWAMAAMASAAGALAWLLAYQTSGSRTAATMAWLACCVNGPWVFNSFAVYPEVPAALAVMLAWLAMSPTTAVFRIGAGMDSNTPAAGPAGASGAVSNGTLLRWLLCGAAIATLPWFSTKYVLMAGAITVIALGRLWWPEICPKNNRFAINASAALLTPIYLSVTGWLTFFYAIWGTYSPTAPYGSQRETKLAYLPAGGPGLLFDQEYGVIAFAPVLFLALTGLFAMLAARGRARRLALEILFAAGMLLGTVGAFHIWWGGSATVGRPIIAGLLLLALPFAYRFEQQRAKPALIAAYQVLMIAGIAIGLTLAFAQSGMLLAAHRSGVSRLLEWLSPTWTLWTIAPTFITETPLAAAALTMVWIVAALAAGWWLGRQPVTLTPGHATLRALAACVAALLVVSIVVPVLGLGRHTAPRVSAGRAHDDASAGYAETAGVTNTGPGDSPDLLVSRLRARGRSELLDRFDGTHRPIAIVYDPWRRIEPASAPPLVELVARPSDRRPRQPIPLLYNARWSLPAGRYSIELIAPAPGTTPANPAAGTNGSGTLTGTLSLQLGYSGKAAREWEVSMGTPGVWGRTFDLLTDINLVGFRASPEIERAGPTIRVRPEAIVDVHARLPPAEVVSAALLGDTTVYFHDRRTHAEGEGFWTPGSSTIMMTMASARGKAPVLGLRAGPVRTAIVLAAQDWRERISLEPNGERRVTLPISKSGMLRVLIETSTGFVPAEIDPASQDRRSLGVWITAPSS